MLITIEPMRMTEQIAAKDILVVDDDPYLCEIISEVLQAEGYTTRTASNGQEALERIHERKPGLILLDLMMPVMSGWEMAEVMRSDQTLADIPIVIITANHQINGTQQKVGAKAVITKPFDIDLLATVVHTYAS